MESALQSSSVSWITSTKERFRSIRSRFLVVAQRFQLEGLISPDTDEENVEDKLDMKSDYDTRSAETEMKNHRPEETEIKPPRSRKTDDTAIVSIDGDVTNMAEVDAKIMEYVVKNEDGSYSCGMCGKNSGFSI